MYCAYNSHYKVEICFVTANEAREENCHNGRFLDIEEEMMIYRRNNEEDIDEARDVTPYCDLHDSVPHHTNPDHNLPRHYSRQR